MLPCFCFEVATEPFLVWQKAFEDAQYILDRIKVSIAN